MAIIIYYFSLEYKNFYKYFFYSLFFAFIFVLLHTFFQLTFNVSLFGNSISHRLFLFKDEEILGSYLARLSPLLIGLYYYLNPKMIFKKHIYICIFLILIGIAIFSSGERVAVFIYLSSIIISFILVKESKRVKLFYILVFFILTLIVTMNENFRSKIIYKTYNQIFTKHESQIFPNSNVNIFSIEHEWHFISAIKMFKNNIIFGVGPKNFRIECLKEEYFVKYGCSTHPHNTFIQLLSETGIIGSFPIILLFIYLSFYFIQKLIFFYTKESNKNFNFKLFIYIAVYLSICPFIPNGNFFGSWLSVITFIPLGFILNFKENE